MAKQPQGEKIEQAKPAISYEQLQQIADKALKTEEGLKEMIAERENIIKAMADKFTQIGLDMQIISRNSVIMLNPPETVQDLPGPPGQRTRIVKG